MPCLTMLVIMSGLVIICSCVLRDSDFWQKAPVSCTEPCQGMICSTGATYSRCSINGQHANPVGRSGMKLSCSSVYFSDRENCKLTTTAT